MGHTRLGTLPKTQKWIEIIATIAGGSTSGADEGTLVDEVQQIADKTLEVAGTGLEKAVSDPGLSYTFYLLTQIALSSRMDNWRQPLSQLGINLAPDSTLFDLTSGLQNAIDDHLFSQGRSTDISEMAQKAAGEAVATLTAPWAATLFGSGSTELQDAVKTHLSTKKGFSNLGQQFFGRFLNHFLNFYLSRVTAAQVGTARLQQVGDLSQFNGALQAHCEQTARIVRDFCGEWYSKTEFQEGINPDNSSRFVAVALRKLKSELKEQRAEL